MRYNPPGMPQSRINLEQVRHIAVLSRLALNENQLLQLISELEPILDYVAIISRADVSGIEPMAHAAHLVNVFREDEIDPALPLDKVLQNAPETDGRFFKVPKIIGGEEDSVA